MTFSPTPLYIYNYEGSEFSGYLLNYDILDVVLLPPNFSVPEPSSLLALVAMGAVLLSHRRSLVKRS